MAENNKREGNGERWRELCEAAAIEPDSDKLVSLVRQILRAFDEHDQVVALSRRPQMSQSNWEQTTRS